MVRAGGEGARRAQHLRRAPTSAPVWCFERYGQSITCLPDGRFVQIGGEHEDSYDRDFCIYNDVFVHRPDGTFEPLRLSGGPVSADRFSHGDPHPRGHDLDRGQRSVIPEARRARGDAGLPPRLAHVRRRAVRDDGRWSRLVVSSPRARRRATDRLPKAERSAPPATSTATARSPTRPRPTGLASRDVAEPQELAMGERARTAVGLCRGRARLRACGPGSSSRRASRRASRRSSCSSGATRPGRPAPSIDRA